MLRDAARPRLSATRRTLAGREHGRRACSARSNAMCRYHSSFAVGPTPRESRLLAMAQTPARQVIPRGIFRAGLFHVRLAAAGNVPISATPGRAVALSSEIFRAEYFAVAGPGTRHCHSYRSSPDQPEGPSLASTSYSARNIPRRCHLRSSTTRRRDARVWKLPRCRNSLGVDSRSIDGLVGAAAPGA